MKKLLLTTLLLAVSTQSFAVQFAFREPMSGVKANPESPAYAPSEGADDGSNDNSDTIPESPISPTPEETAEEKAEKEWIAFVREKCGSEISKSGGFTCSESFSGELPTSQYPYGQANSISFYGDSYSFTNLDSFSSIRNMRYLNIPNVHSLRSVYGLRYVVNTDTNIDYSYQAASAEGFKKVPTGVPFCQQFWLGDLCD